MGKKCELLYFCLPFSSKAATSYTAQRRIWFLQNTEAVPKLVCRVDIDECGACDRITGVPGSAEPRCEKGVGQEHISKCYIATLFISHVSIILLLLHRLLTPGSQLVIMEVLG